MGNVGNVVNSKNISSFGDPAVQAPYSSEKIEKKEAVVQQESGINTTATFITIALTVATLAYFLLPKVGPCIVPKNNGDLPGQFQYECKPNGDMIERDMILDSYTEFLGGQSICPTVIQQFKDRFPSSFDDAVLATKGFKFGLDEKAGELYAFNGKEAAIKLGLDQEIALPDGSKSKLKRLFDRVIGPDTKEIKEEKKEQSTGPEANQKPNEQEVKENMNEDSCNEFACRSTITEANQKSTEQEVKEEKKEQSIAPEVKQKPTEQEVKANPSEKTQVKDSVVVHSSAQPCDGLTLSMAALNQSAVDCLPRPLTKDFALIEKNRLSSQPISFKKESHTSSLPEKNITVLPINASINEGNQSLPIDSIPQKKEEKAISSHSDVKNSENTAANNFTFWIEELKSSPTRDSKPAFDNIYPQADYVYHGTVPSKQLKVSVSKVPENNWVDTVKSSVKSSIDSIAGTVNNVMNSESAKTMADQLGRVRDQVLDQTTTVLNNFREYAKKWEKNPTASAELCEKYKNCSVKLDFNTLVHGKAFDKTKDFTLPLNQLDSSQKEEVGQKEYIDRKYESSFDFSSIAKELDQTFADAALKTAKLAEEKTKNVADHAITITNNLRDYPQKGEVEERQKR